MDLGLKDKVVVCMSSASGFGKGIATEFAHEGAKQKQKLKTKNPGSRI